MLVSGRIIQIYIPHVSQQHRSWVNFQGPAGRFWFVELQFDSFFFPVEIENRSATSSCKNSRIFVMKRQKRSCLFCTGERQSHSGCAPHLRRCEVGLTAQPGSPTSPRPESSHTEHTRWSALCSLPYRERSLRGIPHHSERFGFSLGRRLYFALLMKFLRRIQTKASGQSSSSR